MDTKKSSLTALDPHGRLCQVPEAAVYLALSRSKVYELMEAGQLTYVKIGRSRRIPVSALLALIEANRVGR